MLEWTVFDIDRMRANWTKLAHIAQPAALMNLINPLANAIIMAMLAISTTAQWQPLVPVLA